MSYMEKKMEHKFRVLDLFSGAGGFSCGLDMVEGFHTEVAIDFDQKAINTFQKNFPDTYCIHGNICDEDIKNEIVKASTDRKVNMIIGGPPCQGFSLKGKNLGIKDPRNFLFQEYVNLVSRIKPEIFIIENVKNLLASAEGFFINQIHEEFEALGYTLNHGILNAYNFGVPQTRERTIIIGTLDKRGINLPSAKIIEAEGIRIGVVHGEVYPRADTQQLVYIAKELEADILISGHSHQPKIEQTDGVLLINPGSPIVPRLADRTVMILEVENREVNVEIIKIGAPVCSALDLEKFKRD